MRTQSNSSDARLINVDAELVVFRDDATKIDATNIVVADENTITCQVDLNGADLGMWGVTVEPEYSDAARGQLNDALQIVPRRSDFNDDSQVNFLDWAQLANNWRQTCSGPDWCAGIDLDQSGSVDFGDLVIFTQEWLLTVQNQNGAGN